MWLTEVNGYVAFDLSGSNEKSKAKTEKEKENKQEPPQTS